MGTYSDKANDVFGFMKVLSKELPEVADGFMKLHMANAKDGALDVKQKELIALGIAISSRCEGCIAAHTGGALQAGATPEEIMETIGVAIMMGGGPSVTYGNIAYKALKEMSEK